MRFSWIIFVARRYLRVKRKTSGIGSAMLAVLGVCVGVMALITVLSVMNGFQLNFIEDILEISSYHVRITDPEGDISTTFLDELRSEPDVRAVLAFRDLQTLCRGGGSDYIPCLIRALPSNTGALDPGLIEQLNIYRGAFDLSATNNIIIGYETAYKLGVDLEDTLSIVSMAGDSFSLLSPQSLDFTVTGIFKSGYYEFDSNLSFISLEGAETISDTRQLVYGIKLNDSYKDQELIRTIASSGKLGERLLLSWRDYNKAFFGALRMEKNAMMILVGLIFLVVGLNIYYSQKRNVMERQEEIGIMRTLGATPLAVREVFLLEGMLIGIIGAAIGTLAGLLLAQNIHFIFFAGEILGNTGVTLGNKLFQFIGFGPDYFPAVTRAFFYLPEVPVRVLPGEVFMIFMFAFFSSVAAAFFASRRISEINPSQVLRYE